MARRSALLLVALLLAMVVAVSAADIVQTRGELNIVLERRQDNSTTPSPEPPSSSTPVVTTSNSLTTLSTPSPSPSTSSNPQTSSPDTSKTTATTPKTSATSSDELTTSSTKTTLAPTTRPSTTQLLTSKSGDQNIVLTHISYVTETPVVEVPVTTSPKKGNLSGSPSNEGGSSGLDTKQKNIVIGVCVGVGGAILLGALGIVLFRYRKKRVNPVDEDDLMRRDGSPLAGSHGKEGSDASPFQATLDQYHRQPINTSSNF